MESETQITLQPGATAYLSVRQILVSLTWHAAVDLDLMAFYKTKQGQVGGVYSDNYQGGSLGSLHTFPFIQLSGDEGVGAVSGDKEEVLRISKIEDMEVVYICALNYSDTFKGHGTTFHDYDGQVEICDESGQAFYISLDAKEEGSVAVIAKIDNTDTKGAKLVNENRIISLTQFLTSIPGAEHFKVTSKVILKEKGDSFEIKPIVGVFGEIVVNLNWNQKQDTPKTGLLTRWLSSSTSRGIDLDLGCLFELRDGRKGAVQALGNVFGNYDEPPYIVHTGDDRTGETAEGEFIRVNGLYVSELHRILFYAFIYQGISRWSEADAVVSIKAANSPEIVVHLDEHRDNLGMCALALFENTGGRLRVFKELQFFHGHEDMDRAYHWDLQWASGSKGLWAKSGFLRPYDKLGE